MALQKAHIIQTALAILNRDGLEGVTLRRLAKELDVKAASIYWHIDSKEVLLDEMANAILDQHFGNFDFDNDDRDWEEWLATLMHELRAAMLAYRQGARVVTGAHPDIAIVLVKLWDLTIRVLHKGGFSYGKAATITVSTTNFTFGSVIEEQESPPIAPKSPSMDIRLVDDPFPAFPAFAAAIEEWMTEDNDSHFATGVRIFIQGARAEKAHDEK